MEIEKISDFDRNALEQTKKGIEIAQAVYQHEVGRAYAQYGLKDGDTINVDGTITRKAVAQPDAGK